MTEPLPRTVRVDLNEMGMGVVEVGGVNIANLTRRVIIISEAGKPTQVRLTLVGVRAEASVRIPAADPLYVLEHE